MTGNRICVLHFTNSMVRGGAEEHILTLLRGLDRERFSLHLICSPAVAALIRSDLPADVQLTPLLFRDPFDLRAAWRLARILRSARIDILHSHLFYSSLFASPVGRAAGVPVIVETPHVRELWRKGWKANHLVDRIVGRFVDYYIGVSESNSGYLRAQKRLPARKIVTIRNGCDLSRFDPAHRPPLEFREKLKIGPSDPVLLVSGRLEPQKGHSVLLKALPSVVAEFPTVHLVCAGEGALRDSLQAQARALGIADRVHFVGYQNNIADWLAVCDFTVLPSFYEGLPLAAIESLAAARPVVATAVDGTPEIVVNEETGLTVPPANPEALSAAIRRLLRDKALQDSLAAAGREWVVGHFSDQRQIGETQDFYLRVCERYVKRRRHCLAHAQTGAR